MQRAFDNLSGDLGRTHPDANGAPHAPAESPPGRRLRWVAGVLGVAVVGIAGLAYYWYLLR